MHRNLTASTALLLLCLACREETTAPVSTADLPADATLAPADAIDAEGPQAGLVDNRSSRPGLVFGSVSMPNSYLDNVHTGWMTGGPLTPKSILSHLSGARAKGGRVVIKLCKGKDSYVKNGDGTFSLTKWKALVGSYQKVNLNPYISDGTIIGHYLIDEPHRAQRWGGKAISQATLEEMAKYSKQLWPDMTTIVRASPSTLAEMSSSFKYVDAGWLQYRNTLGDAAKVARLGGRDRSARGTRPGRRPQPARRRQRLQQDSRGQQREVGDERQRDPAIRQRSARPAAGLWVLQLDPRSGLLRTVGHQSRHGRRVGQGQGPRQDVLSPVIPSSLGETSAAPSRLRGRRSLLAQVCVPRRVPYV